MAVIRTKLYKCFMCLSLTKFGTGGLVNAHCGRDPIVKIYTTITDRYAPLHQTVIAGTAGEAIHALDGILGHESNANLSALHVDGGGVS